MKALFVALLGAYATFDPMAFAQAACDSVTCAPDDEPDSPGIGDDLARGLSQYALAMDTINIEGDDPARRQEQAACMWACVDVYTDSVGACLDVFASTGPAEWVPQPEPTAETPSPAPATAYQWCANEAGKKLDTCLGPSSATYITCLGG